DWEQHRQHSQSHPRWQSLCTEMHKQFRLIEVDLLFLRTARRTPTVERRLQQLGDRLSTLIDYCDIGIKLNQQIAPSPEQDVLPCSGQSS
ncbi:MAG: heterocyst frequency control protein PatD, partial [Symploca sp. SIO2B6]|nr:heterocyst frequency control protein PatD [Symploca sp. SIO2B6]